MAFEIIRPATHEEWLAERGKGIGSSEVGTILGVNPFDTPLKLWRRKMGIDAPVEENEAMLMGHLLEDAVAKRWEISTEKQVIKASQGDWIMVDKERHHLRVSPDRTYWIAGEKHNQQNKGILECKTTMLDIDEDTIPKSWFCQLMYQLGVAGYREGSLAWLKMGRHFGTKHYDFNPDFYDWMVGELDRFWVDNILGKKAPDPINASDVLLKNPKHEPGKVVEATEELYASYDRLKDIKAKIAELTGQKDGIEEQIKMAMGDAEAIEYHGSTLATWKASKDSQKFSEKALKEADPDTWSKYLMNVAGTRRFTLKSA